MQGSLTLVVFLNIGETHIPTQSGFCPFQHFQALFLLFLDVHLFSFFFNSFIIVIRQLYYTFL